MVALDLTTIYTHLKTKGHDVKLQEETQQIYEVITVNSLEYALFIKVSEEKTTLQLMMFYPIPLKDQYFGEVGRLLHLLNKTIDVPGFCMDENTRIVFYRSVIPAIDNSIDDDTLDAYVASTKLIAETFSNVIQAVAQGTASYQEVAKKAKEEFGVQ